MANPLVSLPVYNPQLALLVKTPPEGDGWLHEVKLDGYRIGCRLDRGRATLFSRRAKDWTEPFATIASGAERLRARTALLDGEVAAVTPDGRTSLHAMQEGSTIAYFVFDLLHLDGDDLTSLPIEERQVRLRELLGARPRPPFKYVAHVVGGGVPFFAEACQHRLEGIISKAAGSLYRSGARNATWQKVKCSLRQEFVIGGYEHSIVGSLGAVWLGTYEADGSLRFAGKVGTGFQREARELLILFKSLARPTTPFAATGLPTGFKAKGVAWLEPRMVCEVAFMEWTHHGHIRHASYQGPRPDKEPGEVVRELPGRVPILPKHLR
jgi:bifunctional non-homologous end joining protein LigD